MTSCGRTNTLTDVSLLVECTRLVDAQYTVVSLVRREARQESVHLPPRAHLPRWVQIVSRRVYLGGQKPHDRVRHPRQKIIKVVGLVGNGHHVKVSHGVL